MNKLFTKIATLLVGSMMAIGVGVAIGSNQETRVAEADGTAIKYNAIVSGQKYFITATHDANEYALEAGRSFNAGASGIVAYNGANLVESQAWTFTGSGTSWTISTVYDNNTYYLGVTAKNDGLACNSTSPITWTLQQGSTDDYAKFYTADSKPADRYLALYQSTNWRCYASSSGVQDIKLYRYTAPSKTLTKMDVITDPDTTSYTESATFNPTGMVIRGTYSDLSTATISNANITWSNDGILSYGQTSLTGSFQNVSVNVTGLTVSKLTVSSLSTVYAAAIALGEGNKGTTYYRYSGVITTINGGNYYIQDATNGYAVCVYSNAAIEGATVGKKLTIVSCLQNYFNLAESYKILTTEVSENEGSAVSAANITTYSDYSSVRSGVLMNLTGLKVLGSISAAYNTALESTDTLGFGSDAISYYVAKGLMTSELATQFSGIVLTDTIDLNNVVRSTSRGLEFVSASTVTITPAAVTLSSISIRTNPTTTSYHSGDLLDITGLSLTATYSDESTAPIASGFTVVDEIVPFSFADAEAGSKTFTVNYGGKSTTFNVTVKKGVGYVKSDSYPDVLNYTNIGVPSTTYTVWTGDEFGSGISYKGKTSGGADEKHNVQFRTTGSDEGIVTTSSGLYYADSVKIVWNTTNANVDGRKLDVYGSNTAYTAASDLYNASNQGISLGSITYHDNETCETELLIDENVKPMYLTFSSINNSVSHVSLS